MKKPDVIERLLQVSEECISYHVKAPKRCRCREKIKAILKELGVTKKL